MRFICASMKRKSQQKINSQLKGVKNELRSSYNENSK